MPVFALQRFKCLAFAFLLLLSAAPAFAQAPTPPAIAAREWLLLDLSSGQVLGSLKPDEKVEPASLTKLMTAYVVFEALHQKSLSLDTPVLVSEKAWKTGGSRMFIKVGDTVPAGELIKGMIIQSGNDASIALAEAVGGSEEGFVQLMNRDAARLGMKDTHFSNATGLPNPTHLTTAHDLSLVAQAIIRDFPEEYARYYSTKEFCYNKICQPNRNRLLWLDPSVDGMKTGFTDAAGYCLVSSAKRGQRRLLSVVLGTASAAARIQESQKLLNWGFLAFDAALQHKAGEPLAEAKVWKGSQKTVKVGFLTDFVVTVPKGETQGLKARLVTNEPLMAPLRKGQKVGVLRLTLDGKPYGERPVEAMEDVPLGGWFSRLVDAILLWFS
jgi:D-alanyl-D-alanine carboxypeptidase (penicillin-binding protein 5/6)